MVGPRVSGDVLGLATLRCRRAPEHAHQPSIILLDRRQGPGFQGGAPGGCAGRGDARAYAAAVRAVPGCPASRADGRFAEGGVVECPGTRGVEQGWRAQSMSAHSEL